MNRREFCRRLSVACGAVILAPLIKACAPGGDERLSVTTTSPADNSSILPTQKPPSPIPSRSPVEEATQFAESIPSATPEPTATKLPIADELVARVALVKTADRAFGVQRAIQLLAVNSIHGNRVLLKPNLNSADDAPGSTHMDIMRALLLELHAMGAKAITVADRSGMADTRRVMEQKGVFDLADEFGVQTLIFDEMDESEWVLRPSNDFYWANGFAVPKMLLDAECVVQTCNLKTHRYGGHFTLSLKNSVGFVAKMTEPGGYNYMNELHNSPYQRSMIAEINTVYKPSLIVMDGVEAFVSGGPAQGKKVDAGVVLASTDRVAIDAVGVAILRYFGTTPQVSRGKIFEQEQISRAVELGLGIDTPASIEFVTGDVDSEAFATLIRRMLIA